MAVTQPNTDLVIANRRETRNRWLLLHQLINASQGCSPAFHQIDYPSQSDHRPHQQSDITVEHHEASERYTA